MSHDVICRDRIFGDKIVSSEVINQAAFAENCRRILSHDGFATRMRWTPGVRALICQRA
jgi:hypothetical protein